MKVYCYSKCGTCKKALKWLDDHHIEYEKTDIKEDHPDEALLRELHKKSGLPLKRFYNTSGKIYKDLGLSGKIPNMTDDEQYKLLASDGMLVKRPLVVGDSFVLVGFKEPEWDVILKRAEQMQKILFSSGKRRPVTSRAFWRFTPIT